MNPNHPDIVLVEQTIDPEILRGLVGRHFEEMVKYVVDLERQVAAGEADCIEFTSLINIRPAQGNRSMEIQDLATCDKLRALTFALIGRGEAV